ILKKISNEEYGFHSLLPSEKQLCEMYHVSIITVRRALSELVSNNIVEKVKGKGTYVKASIRKTETEFDGNIGILIIADSNHPFSVDYSSLPFSGTLYDRNSWVHTIYSPIYKKLANRYNVLLGSYNADEILNHFDRTVFANVQRIFLLSSNREITSFLVNQKKLIVTLNNFEPNIRTCAILSSDRKIVCQAVEYLISLGHQRIASINGRISYGASLERSMGFQEAMIKNGLPIDFSLIKWGNMTAASGYYLTKELFEGAQKPTAIFCANDNMAAGCIYALKELGLRCPNDVSVIGYDNNPDIYRTVTPTLTTIDPMYKTIGEIAADKLSRDIWFDDITTVDGIFLQRASVGAAPQHEMFT
ncbi:MAG: GntR family transcriptional regulator, partial [Clostridia bacterium]|nr:GntR family transcriptional regulator [Clostridia bacterium]